jgi:hypothetical protein
MLCRFSGGSASSHVVAGARSANAFSVRAARILFCEWVTTQAFGLLAHRVVDPKLLRAVLRLALVVLRWRFPREVGGAIVEVHSILVRRL